jgi:hypothetical protein
MIMGRAGLSTIVDGHEGSDTIERFGADAPTVAQAADEFAIVCYTATEGAFCKSVSPAIVCDVSKQLLRVHRTTLCRFLPHMSLLSYCCAGDIRPLETEQGLP